jgi:hypothetical protein
MENPFKITGKKTSDKWATHWDLEVKFLEGEETININIDISKDSGDEPEAMASIGGMTADVASWDIEDCKECLNQLISAAESYLRYYKLWRDFLEFYGLLVAADYEEYPGEDPMWDLVFEDKDIPKLIEIAKEYRVD